MKQEATKELDPGQGEAAHLLAAIVTKAEGHLMRIDALEAAVAQGDTKEIASQVGQDLLAPTGVLAVRTLFEMASKVGRSTGFEIARARHWAEDRRDPKRARKAPSWRRIRSATSSI